MRKFAPLRYSLQFLRQSLYCRNNYPHCSASRFGCRYGYSYCLSIRNTLHSLAVLLRISTGSHPRRSDYNRKEPLLRFQCVSHSHESRKGNTSVYFGRCIFESLFEIIQICPFEVGNIFQASIRGDEFDIASDFSQQQVEICLPSDDTILSVVIRPGRISENP